MKDLISPSIHDVTQAILADYDHGRPIDKLDIFNQPDSKVIYELIGELTRIAYPGFVKDKAYRLYDVKNNLSTFIKASRTCGRCMAVALLSTLTFASGYQRLRRLRTSSMMAGNSGCNVGSPLPEKVSVCKGCPDVWLLSCFSGTEMSSPQNSGPY